MAAPGRRSGRGRSEIQPAPHTDPNHADCWANLGAIRSAQERPADAADCYRQALKVQPQHPAATFNLGVVLLGSANRRSPGLLRSCSPTLPPTDQPPAQIGTPFLPWVAQPRPHSTRTLPHDPTRRPRAWHQFGLALGHIGRDADSVDALARPVARLPTSGEARVSLGQLSRPSVAGRGPRLLSALQRAPGLPERDNLGSPTLRPGGRSRRSICSGQWLPPTPVAGIAQQLAPGPELPPRTEWRCSAVEHVAWAARHADALAPANPPR